MDNDAKNGSMLIQIWSVFPLKHLLLDGSRIFFLFVCVWGGGGGGGLGVKGVGSLGRGL